MGVAAEQVESNEWEDAWLLKRCHPECSNSPEGTRPRVSVSLSLAVTISEKGRAWHRRKEKDYWLQKDLRVFSGMFDAAFALFLQFLLTHVPLAIISRGCRLVWLVVWPSTALPVHHCSRGGFQPLRRGGHCESHNVMRIAKSNPSFWNWLFYATHIS